MNSFMLSYRNKLHATTKASPASLLMKRELRTSFNLLKPQNAKETKCEVNRRVKPYIVNREQRTELSILEKWSS